MFFFPNRMLRRIAYGWPHVSDQAEAPQPQEPQPQAEQPQEGFEPTKLLRLGMMTQEMLGEARRAPLDDQARERMAGILEKTLKELKKILPTELERELEDVTLPLGDDPSEAELRMAQSQLVGWLEGLFHGIQAAVFAQQMQMQAQAQGFPRRQLPQGGENAPGGQYL